MSWCDRSPSAAWVGSEGPGDRPWIHRRERAAAVVGVLEFPGDFQAGGLCPLVEAVGVGGDDVEPVRRRAVPAADDDAATAVRPAQFNFGVAAGLLARDQGGRLEA